MGCAVRDLQDEEAPTPRLAEAAEGALAAIGAVPGEMWVVLVDDERIQDLNSRFRGLDRPTDVLSFGAEEAPDEEACAGEVVIAVPTARRQAEASGIELEQELCWLAAHGALHLAGMDDETQEDLDRMLVLQQRVMGMMGWPPHP